MVINDKVSSRIDLFKKVYLVLFIMGALIVCVLLAGFSKKHNTEELPQILIGLVLFYSIYYGLKKKRRWVIPVVLVFPAYQLLSYLFSIHAGTSEYLSINIISTAFKFSIALFYVYQIYFFSKKEVRKLFGVGEQILF